MAHLSPGVKLRKDLTNPDCAAALGAKSVGAAETKLQNANIDFKDLGQIKVDVGADGLQTPLKGSAHHCKV
jgi:hypothetical protein